MSLLNRRLIFAVALTMDHGNVWEYVPASHEYLSMTLDYSFAAKAKKSVKMKMKQIVFYGYYQKTHIQNAHNIVCVYFYFVSVLFQYKRIKGYYKKWATAYNKHQKSMFVAVVVVCKTYLVNCISMCSWQVFFGN